MSTEQQEYVLAPWESDGCDTAICTIELPSRELVVQLEAPTSVLDRMARLADEHGVSTEQCLAERLEMNRARLSLLAARSVDEVAQVRALLEDTREFLAGVETLEAADVEADIETFRNSELGSE